MPLAGAGDAQAAAGTLPGHPRGRRRPRSIGSSPPSAGPRTPVSSRSSTVGPSGSSGRRSMSPAAWDGRRRRLPPPRPRLRAPITLANEVHCFGDIFLSHLSAGNNPGPRPGRHLREADPGRRRPVGADRPPACPRRESMVRGTELDDRDRPSRAVLDAGRGEGRDLGLHGAQRRDAARPPPAARARRSRPSSRPRAARPIPRSATARARSPRRRA